MEASDPVLLKIITSHPNLSEVDYRALEAWWLVDRRPDENAVNFMVRQGVFIKDAPRTIEMLRKGMLTYWDPNRIFGEHGHQRLHEYAQQAGITGHHNADPHGKGTPLPGSPKRLSEVRDWLAKRAEAKQATATSTRPEVAKPPTPHTPVHAAPATTSRSSAAGNGRLSPIPDRASQIFDRKKFPEIGEQYGKYLLTEEVARGGTAVVFRALNRSLNSTVAIKILKLDKEEGLNPEQTEMLESLRREAHLLARFNHPNLVRVHDIDEEATYPYLVLEFVDGLSLLDMLAHVGRLRLDRAIRIISSVAEGLSAAHNKIGLVHRDIKPGNILLARDGCVKLADLGLAMTTDTWTGNSSASSSVLAGTAAYMAPELCTSGECDLRTDIYSLGATFYHAVVGEMPFKGKNRMEVMLKHTREMPIAPHQLVAGLDVSVSDVILRMMAKQPDDRYSSYEELLSDLRQLHTRSSSDMQIVLPAFASTAS